MMRKLDLARMVRPLVAAALVASGSAVGLSRLAQAPARPRAPAAERHVLISPYGVDPGGPGSLWLDAETGRTTRLDPPGDEILDHASHSSWSDESGRLQVVGRSSRRPSDPAPGDMTGLVRMTFPDARVLDRVAVDSPPASPPCWFPGRTARVLFGGLDGRLYQFDFEPPYGPAGGGDPDGPRPVTWKCDPPGRGEPRIADPCWPADPRFSRTILAVLQAIPHDRSAPRLHPGRIWWLRLTPEGDAIEECGPLLVDDASPEPSGARMPTVVPTRGGGLALAYYAGESPLGPWDLWLTPLAFDESGRPRIAAGRGTRIADDCRPFPAAASADGRWIAAVQLNARGLGTIVRLDLAALEEGPARAARDRPRSPRGTWVLLESVVRALLGEVMAALTEAGSAA